MSDDAEIELSVILTAFNEGPAVAGAVQAHVAALAECCPRFELIVVNDGSRDDTLEQARRAAAGDARVRVLSNEKNLGQVASILRGFREARGEVLMHNAVDMPFDPRDTPRVLDLMRRGADVVVVERSDRGAYGVVRKVVSWCNVALVKLLLGSPFTDHNFTQAYRRRVIEAVPVESRGVSTVTPELILKAYRQGFCVERIACPYAARRSGKSTVTLGKIVHTTAELFRLRRIMRRWGRGPAPCAGCAAEAQSPKSSNSGAV